MGEQGTENKALISNTHSQNQFFSLCIQKTWLSDADRHSSRSFMLIVKSTPSLTVIYLDKWDEQSCIQTDLGKAK